MHVALFSLDTKSIAAYTGPGKLESTSDFLFHIIPGNFFDAFAKNEIFQVLLIAILFGFALHKFGGRGNFVYDCIEKFSHVLFGMVGLIMKAAPIVAFCAMAFTISKYGVGSLLSLGQQMGAFYMTCLVFILVILGGVSKAHGCSLHCTGNRHADEPVLATDASGSAATDFQGGAAGVIGSGSIVLVAPLLALILGIDPFMSEARALTNTIGKAWQP